MSRSNGHPVPRLQNLAVPDLLRDLLAVLSLWMLVCVCYWRIALAGRVLAAGDVFTYFYPYWAEATRAIRSGRLPLWNPYLFMGAPFLANSQAGFFYPLNWPLWLLLPAHRSVHLTIVAHLGLAGLTGYLWGRTSLRLEHISAWTVGSAFALGGYLGAHVEHVNQLQGLAWLPLMLMLWDRVSRSASLQAGKWPLAGLGVVIGLVMLTGHTQTAFVSLVGLAAYGLGSALWDGLRRRKYRPLLRRVVLLAVVAGMGAALAAAQLVPTWELSLLSVRAEGLPFNERVSFSLSPLYLARALLPGFAEPVPPEHIEHVAYIGVAGLVLAAVASSRTRCGIRSTCCAPRRSAICLLALGLFLALGRYNPLYLLLARYVPGFAHFRVPARWLALYAVGMAGLVGCGVDALWQGRAQVGRRTTLLLVMAVMAPMAWAVVGVAVGEQGCVSGLNIVGWGVAGASTLGLLVIASHFPRPATMGLVALLIAELIAAGSTLPHWRSTAPQAFTSLRPAIAQLLAFSKLDEGRARFLSMSDIGFDPGDLPAIERIYGPQLSDDALYDFVIAAKRKEVLSPNLPLGFGISAVDGYGGGVLPLDHYVTLERLFLPDDRISIDGRLRENLTAIPDERWLSLFNIRYVITDKLRDAWIDDVFYDLQFGARLSRGEEAKVAYVPRFEATALGVVFHLSEEVTMSEGASAGVVEMGLGDGSTRAFVLQAGQQGGRDADELVGNGQVTRLPWPEPTTPVTVAVRATLTEGELIVRGMSLIDERTGGFQSLVLSDRGRFRLVHSGDVKIYENLGVLPRAFIVHEASTAASDEAALAAMRNSAFDPAAEVVLATDGNGDRSSCSELEMTLSGQLGTGVTRITSYQPEHVEIEAHLARPGYLVLSDAWYPGWRATVDGERVPLHRADLLFRAVAVDAGRHRVTFAFRPKSPLVGAVISLVTLTALSGSMVIAICRDRGGVVQSEG